MKFTMRTFQGNMYYASLCAYLPALSFGFVIGYTSPALPEMEKDKIFVENQGAWFGSLATIGAMFGSFLGGWLTQAYGRRMTLLATSIPFFLGWGLIWWYGGLLDLYVGRTLTGLASGMTVVSSPMYISETCTKELRGMLGSGVQLSITLGILTVYFMGCFSHWYTLAAVAAFIPVIAVLLTLRVPDTPRYYMMKNQKLEAGQSLTWLRGTTSSEIEEELRDIGDSLDGDSKVGWGEFRQPQLLKPLLIASGLMFFQQVSGINVVMFYTVSIFEAAGYGDNSTLATVVIGAVQVAFTCLACILMDRAGRRYLLLIGGAGMALTCYTLGFYYYVQRSGATLSWLALLSLTIYIVSFSLGWGPIPMLIMSEIFPIKARSTASGITSVVVWIAGFFVTRYFIFLTHHLGSDGTFWLFGSCCLIGMLFVYSCVPETKGKSLEDIEMYFLNRGKGIV